METNGITARFDHAGDQYVVVLSPQAAHVLIWGGSTDEVGAVESELRDTLVALEDSNSDEWYAKHFGARSHD